MNILKLFALFLLIIVLFLYSCSSNKDDSSSSKYTKISADKAKDMMDKDSSVIILDVRTKQEYEEGHIEGAILIPNTELINRANKELPDKDATILVYCRSGNRSAKAAKELIEAGYTNVFDFGGINNWKHEIVTN
ncbi:MAG: rhodanese-like domain-containing protein [Clostridiales bacterium]|nr:rhodanese-like domain-containing protein [Clostridiales bacterium]